MSYRSILNSYTSMDNVLHSDMNTLSKLNPDVTRLSCKRDFPVLYKTS
jgi:hypothetical protein